MVRESVIILKHAVGNINICFSFSKMKYVMAGWTFEIGSFFIYTHISVEINSMCVKQDHM